MPTSAIDCRIRRLRLGLIVLAVMSPWLALSARAADLPVARPERVGFDPARLERLDPALKSYVKSGKVPDLAIMVARQGKLVYARQYGQGGSETGAALGDDTLIRLYGLSRPVTAVALMMLYEEGRFQLSDPISYYLPELAGLKVFDGMTYDGKVKVMDAYREPTIADLLSGTAGFSHAHSNDPVATLYRDRGYRSRTGNTLADMTTTLAAIPLLTQPGERWMVSIGPDVEARLVEVLSGKRFDIFLKDRIFGPLGMTDTGFFVPEGKIGRFAAAWRFEDGQKILADDPATSPFRSEPTFFSGSDGLVSTPSDYLRFAQMLLNGGVLEGARLLSPKTVELMTTDQLADGVSTDQGNPTSFGFGLGLGVRTSLLAEDGTGSPGEIFWDTASPSYFWIDPKEKLIGFLAAQSYPPDPRRLQQTFHTLVYQAIVD